MYRQALKEAESQGEREYLDLLQDIVTHLSSSTAEYLHDKAEGDMEITETVVINIFTGILPKHIRAGHLEQINQLINIVAHSKGVKITVEEIKDNE